jgi:hypothetical protein
MSAGMIVVLWKGPLGFGLPIAFSFWELYQLRKERLKDEAKAAAAGTRAGAPVALLEHRPAPALPMVRDRDARGSARAPRRRSAG